MISSLAIAVVAEMIEMLFMNEEHNYDSYLLFNPRTFLQLHLLLVPNLSPAEPAQCILQLLVNS